MAGLMLKFPAGDRIVINGAVIENVGRGARLRLLTPDTQLLRLRDAIDPRGATTPVARIAHDVQMMLIGEIEPQDGVPAALSSLEPLRQAFMSEDDRNCIDSIVLFLREKHFYQALRLLGRLRRKEAVLLSVAST